MNDAPLTTERLDDRGRAARRPLELAVIVPTFNERDNLRELYGLIADALRGVRWEMVIVDDDSPDGTASEARRMAVEYDNVRALQRIGRRGLSTAVIEGMLATTADRMAVIDADLQHDESKLPEMLEILRGGQAELVIGSRYQEGGGIGEWNPMRAAMSRFATRVSRMIVKGDLNDPMSGFFMIERAAFERVVRELSGEGYKILLDLFASSRSPIPYAEVPYTFRDRKHGESKLDGAALWGYLLLVLDKWLPSFIPARLVMFGIVGLSGVVVHFLVLSIAFQLAKAPFEAAQLLATIVAMTTNYAFNNAITYRDKAKRGWSFVTGLIGFYAICAVGLIGNVGVASAIFYSHYQWWLAAIAGILIGTIWNYAVSSLFIWRR